MKNLNELDSLLNQLEKIQEVDAPPFLHTRILEKINRPRTNRFSLRLTWSMAASLVLIVALNVIVVSRGIPATDDSSAVAQSMDLIPDNSLYK
jgi:hypothetical protein